MLPTACCVRFGQSLRAVLSAFVDYATVIHVLSALLQPTYVYGMLACVRDPESCQLNL